jgi:hypothetical protein
MMPVDDSVVAAASRVLKAWEEGAVPQCRDIWTMQLSVSPRDAADLLLPHDELARKIVAAVASTSTPQLKVRSASGY